MTDNERIELITNEIINLDNSQVDILGEYLENESLRNAYVFDNPPDTDSISKILWHYGLLFIIKQKAIVHFAKYETYRRV